MTTYDPSAPSVIRVQGLGKIYPDPNLGSLIGNLGRWLVDRPPSGTTALDGIDFDVVAGEAFGVVGRNGSGKSTLLQILAGALQPTSGVVDVMGRVGSLLDLTAGINPEYTGAENALVLGMLGGLSRGDVRRRMEDIRAFSGLGEAFDRPVKGYSSGMAMRLGFSAAIHSEPEILLIDEALAVGDAFFQQRCLRKLRELRDGGVTIVLVSHDPSAVISLCDRSLWLEHGRIASLGTPNDVIRAYLAARYRDECDLTDDLEPSDPEVERPSEMIRSPAAVGDGDGRFGDGRAKVTGFELRTTQGNRQSTLSAGEEVEIVLAVESLSGVDRPLVGFTIRNRLGDVIVATNTELEGTVLPALPAGALLELAFRFLWPPLCSGPVSFSPAIAEGCIAAHSMCDWVENALIAHCENDRGLFGWLTLQGVTVGMGRLRINEEQDEEQDEELEVRAEGGVDEAVDDRIEFALDEPREFVIDPGQITERRELLFSGWSFSTSGARVEVGVRLKGLEEQALEVGRFREDVARVHSEVPHASRSGFSGLIQLPKRSGVVRCQVEARTCHTDRTVAEFELDLPPAALAIVPNAFAQPTRTVNDRRHRRLSGSPRTLFVSHTLNFEGAQRSLFEVATRLDRECMEATLVSPVDGPMGALWEAAGIAREVLPVDVVLGGPDDYDGMIRRLAGLMSVHRPDLIVANTLETFWSIHVAEELGIGSVWIVRESENPTAYFHSRLPTRIAERGVRALETADRVVFVAEATRALFEGSLPRSRSVVIPNGIDLDRIDEILSAGSTTTSLRARLGVAPGEMLILCVGTPCVRKGQLELIDALYRLSGSGNAPPFKCVFLGVTESEYLRRMTKAIEERHLRQRVLLIEPTHDPRPYFASADLLVCPSFQESLPRSVLEAMAFQLPIVATRIFGVPELVRDGCEGVLVEPGDPDALADAIAGLLADRSRALELGRRARRRVEDQFTLKRAVEAYASLFSGVMAANAMRTG